MGSRLVAGGQQVVSKKVVDGYSLVRGSVLGGYWLGDALVVER